MYCVKSWYFTPLVTRSGAHVDLRRAAFNRRALLGESFRFGRVIYLFILYGLVQSVVWSQV